MDKKKIGIAAAAAVTVGAGVVGGAAIAGAASGDSSARAPYGKPGYGGPGGAFGGGGFGGSDRPGHDHTPVTGAELAKVKAAVEAEDSAVTVQRVLKDPDGSYDVLGTKDDAPVMLEVSKDLKTVTAREGGPGRGGFGGPGGPGGHHAHTPVTGAELTKVKNAVTAKYDDLIVRGVGKDPDGSYDVFGTRDGRPVMLEVSKDLKTITEKTGGPRGDKGAPPAPPED